MKIIYTMSVDEESLENDRFVPSVDSIYGEKFDKCKSKYWEKKPPLVLGVTSYGQSMKTLKQKCHLGLPPNLRCAVWIASVMRVAHPQQPLPVSDSYGTNAKSSTLTAGWESVLNTIFPNPSDETDAIAPDLGLSQELLTQVIKNDYSKFINGTARPRGGEKSLTRILCAVQQILGIEYCPVLPDIATMMLAYMPESYVYATLREMIGDTSNFLPVCLKDHYAWCKTYYFFVKRMFPQAYKVMMLCGAMTVEGLDPIFKRFFRTLLKPDDVLHFLDIFLVEGCKAIFRLSLSLVGLLSKKELKTINFTDATSWWNAIKAITLSPTFSFQKHLDKKVYPRFGKATRRYPKRRVLSRMIRYNEQWALDNMPVYIDQTPPKPMGYIPGKPIILAKPASVRSNLVKWLPVALKSTKLDLIYSTENDGRSLSSFYEKCKRTKHTIVLIEAMTKSSNNKVIIGMFASQSWNVHPTSYGDGECFLFRADPDAKCFHWTPDFSSGFDDIENQVIREQFMVARNEYLAMGANADGTNGLRLDQDLNQGESYPALGFGNEPLAGENMKSFEVGTVEVYRLVRDVDGKAVDGEVDDSVWNLGGM